MTIQEARTECIARLKALYAESEAEAIAELLIEWITGIDRSQRSLQKQVVLSASQEQQFHEALPRLEDGEPIQYITHQAWFCGLQFYVDNRVLIPRPETEELVEWVISNCRFPIQQLSILDIGSGSGCIPVSLKKRLSKSNVVSCDISKDALEVARLNANTLGLEVDFIELDILNEEERARLGRFDFIVSNPPYIPVQEKEKMDKNVVAYEPSLALFVPDNDALLFYRAIAETGKNHLNEDGMILVEMHEDLSGPCEELFRSMGYSTEIKKDLFGKERMLKARAC